MKTRKRTFESIAKFVRGANVPPLRRLWLCPGAISRRVNAMLSFASRGGAYNEAESSPRVAVERLSASALRCCDDRAARLDADVAWGCCANSSGSKRRRGFHGRRSFVRLERARGFNRRDIETSALKLKVSVRPILRQWPTWI